ncbi:Similar to AlaRS-m: Alanine--tRNA ligase [Cotesia congregata]|uniref:Alanine--tRNA ligase n=1 Tax=Cotesia congregata TaxID=51543 RepID=A0A8J2HAQ4_COTCN|nr:Similar to AlaRS-m: Alanine--tRNA ligase [Cotesia congregata]
MYKSGKIIRKEFLDYFSTELDHKIISSSSVIPWCDSSVAFINAGMNQFKGIFLGKEQAPFPRVANCQKCIRVGGKHNDLKDVGLDTYHHTFFEMLGNWSFGSYGKEEACRYAWRALTELYGINKRNLSVTYFAGDQELQMAPDFETRDIWRNIGVPDDKIRGCGAKDNLWEMNLTGPCGPCTEIHYDSVGSGNNLTELWNIVFIDHQRLPDGAVVPLKRQFVDTGMGLERLVALLQNKNSNYDTDLFQPLFQAIHKSSGAPEYSGTFGDCNEASLDTCYRILADHARMVTVALADGIIPDKNQKLRRIQVITNYEKELLISQRKSTGEAWQTLLKMNPRLATISDPYAPGIIKAYTLLMKLKSKTSNFVALSGKEAFRIYDSHGLDLEALKELAEVEGIEVDEEGFFEEMEMVRIRSRVGKKTNRRVVAKKTLEQLKVLPQTDDSFKYQYNFEDKYTFSPLECSIIGVVIDEIALILDQTPFYASEGGQLSDQGTIKLKNGLFKVAVVEKSEGYVLHYGSFDSAVEVEINNEKVTAMIDSERRTNLMMHHTATHLLNAGLRKIFPAVAQRISVVTPLDLIFRFSTFGKKFSPQHCQELDSLVNKCINQNVDVKTEEISSLELMNQKNLTLIPGEVYPDTGLRVVDIDGELKSREACCGTHVHNTGVLKNFCITEVYPKSSSEYLLKAVTGPKAKDAKSKTNLNYLVDVKGKNDKKEIIVDFMKSEIERAVEKSDCFIVHCMKSNDIEPESVPLQLAYNYCDHLPMFLIVMSKKKIRARCFVPKEYQSAYFNAKLWMESINKVLPVELGTFGDEDPLSTSHIKIVRTSKEKIESQTEEAAAEAEKFAAVYFKKLKIKKNN